MATAAKAKVLSMLYSHVCEVLAINAPYNESVPANLLNACSASLR
jgi:hypothetical protein